LKVRYKTVKIVKVHYVIILQEIELLV